MAKVNKNIFTQGLSGSLGDQIIFRQSKDGRTIVALKPTFSEDREFSSVQLEHQEEFREAIAYAQTVKGQEAYINKAKGTAMSAFNAAVADWFNKPEVLEIDITGWNGQVGQIIRVKAQDDVQVTKVFVKISDANGTLIEQGDAVQADGLWWDYTTTTATSMNPAPQVVATAQDLPGNRTDMAWQN